MDDFTSTSELSVWFIVFINLVLSHADFEIYVNSIKYFVNVVTQKIFMTLLIVYITLALGVSFLCSLLEATLLSLTPAYLASIDSRAPALSKRWLNFKEDVEKPLAAILSLNTIAHTVGAAGAGAQATALFGEIYFGVISVILTLLILVVSEIIPKTLGARYCKELAPVCGHILTGVQFLMHPLVVLTEIVTRRFLPKTNEPTMTRTDLQSLVEVGNKEGVLDSSETRSISAMMAFKELTVESVMTPRTVVTMLDSSMNIGDILKEKQSLKFSRLPVFHEIRENVTGFVRKDDIFQQAVEQNTELTLKEIQREIPTVPDSKKLSDLLQQMVNQREQIVHVVNEYGDSVGIATMEDLIETMIGMEIVDESDAYIDMQERARALWKQRATTRGTIQDDLGSKDE